MDYGTPLYQLPLSEHWLLIITNRGYKFYFNSNELVSYWELPESCVAELDEMKRKKNEILLLIGVARGAKVDDSRAGDLNELLHGERYPRDVVEETAQKITSPEEESTSASSNTAKDGISLGYESDSEQEAESSSSGEFNVAAGKPSDHESELESEREPENESESDSDSESDDAVGLNMSDLEDYQEDSSDAAERFYDMCVRYKINPYSSYDLEYEKFINDPVYFEIDDDEKRRSLFDRWCTQAANAQDKVDQSTLAVVGFCKLLVNNGVNFKYYLEFKRKFKSAPEFQAIDSDKLRNKIFNKYIEFRKSDKLAFVLHALRKSGKLVVLTRKINTNKPQKLLDFLSQSNFNIQRDIVEFNFLDQADQTTLLEQFLANA
ncbi:hypothetical protein OGAPHI_000225 [Ogataea philodendri]|uniref:WW domain-containing protein n=1 Tax=Ogataea philodendri TaxID=1378263 RepID=A0A9P8PGA7_9ASCO|nr:uncharacterized protein OGAPHI_000225 [Ogataea philodendri]KAH3671522.1 hypothetical protein OGAPHI_000225 [Ogataea philodendri]